MEAALGLVGGTMGLLTGFSILSGVEIIYHLLRYLVLDFFIPLTLSSGSSCLLRSPELKWSLLSTQDLKIIWQGRIRNVKPFYVSMFKLHQNLCYVLGGGSVSAVGKKMYWCFLICAFYNPLAWWYWVGRFYMAKTFNQRSTIHNLMNSCGERFFTFETDMFV